MTTASVETIQDTLNRIELLCQDIAGNLVITPSQVIIVEGLSELSDSLGMVVAGEFRTGVGTPGRGFYGMRIAYPGMPYNGSLWNLAGVDNDVLEVGISATTGKLLAGGGNVIIDADGINIINSTGYSAANAIQFFDGVGGAVASEIYSYTQHLGIPKLNEMFVGTRNIVGNTSILYLVNEGADSSTIQIQSAGTEPDPYILMNNNTVGHSGKSDMTIFCWDIMTITSQNIHLETSGVDPTINGNVAWHAGNDGSGSGLDADLLDGHQPGSGNGLDADTVDGVHFAVGTWTPVVTGFSADPTSMVGRYITLGKYCTAWVDMPNAGTSDATTFTVSAPFTAATVTGMTWRTGCGFCIDNGTTFVDATCQINTAESVFKVYRNNVASGAWANANGKAASFTITYQIA